MNEDDESSPKRQKRNVSFQEKEEKKEEQEEENEEDYQVNGKPTQEIGMTAFNLKDEREEGHFDENGNFVWRKEERKVQEEAWLENVSEEQMDAARHAQSRRAYRDDLESEQMNLEKANRILAELLNSRETVLQALKRLGSKKRKKPSGNSQNRSQPNASDSANGQPSEQDKKSFEKITEAADFLMRQGEVDVYSQIKEEFEQEVEELEANAEQETEEEDASQQLPMVQQSQDEVQWEYKGADGEIHGPYPTSTILAWQQQGYFGASNPVQMRPVTSSNTSSAGHHIQAQTSSKEEPQKEKMSAADELMNDFDDDEEEATKDDEEEQQEDPSDADASSWQQSNQIDFSQYT